MQNTRMGIYKGLAIALSLANEAAERARTIASEEFDNSSGLKLREAMIFDDMMSSYVDTKVRRAWELKFFETCDILRVPGPERLSKLRILRDAIEDLAEAYRQYEEGLVRLDEHMYWLHMKLATVLAPNLRAEAEDLRKKSLDG